MASRGREFMSQHITFRHVILAGAFAALSAAAAYAAGGHAALAREAANDAEARLLLSQMRGT